MSTVETRITSMNCVRISLFCNDSLEKSYIVAEESLNYNEHLLNTCRFRDFRSPLIIVNQEPFVVLRPVCQVFLNLTMFKDISVLISRVFYNLHEEPNRECANGVLICRLEQLCPVPYDLFS
uniref:Uncharacterized protein n=1 Tax=Physcomitrium patens TaxID=3218 RepID=A0A2K1IUP3_PHYPA|nr:hypothetical protein PHYPA_024938 [Physcomitrium patens]